MLKFRFWGFWRFLRNQKSSPCCKVTFLRSWVVFAYLAKCIGNPIVKKMAWKNADFPFFGPPDGPMNSKITPDLDIDKFYIADWGIFENFIFCHLLGVGRANFCPFFKKWQKLALPTPRKQQKMKNSTYQYQDLGWFLSSLDHLVAQKKENQHFFKPFS